MTDSISSIGETVFETARLKLEPLVAEHAPELFVIYSDYLMYSFIPQEPPLSVEALAERFRFLEARRSPNGTEEWFNWTVRQKSDGQCLGVVQVTILSDGRAQLAYEFGVRFWRHGFATEACSRVNQALFEAGVSEIFAEVDSRNLASMKLLERMGFQRGKLKPNADFFKGESSDEWTYKLLKITD